MLTPLFASVLAAAAMPAVEPVQVRTRMWTVGTSAGTRPSTEVCRWSAELVVHGRLDNSHKVAGSKAGNCRFVKAAVVAERDHKVAALQTRLAAEGRIPHLARAD